MSAVLSFAILFALIGAALALAAKRGGDGEALIAAIDAALPQLQCAKCGYPGCRPYAEAVAAGDAAINLCPPGGDAALRSLAEITGVPPPAPPPPFAAAQTALIDERECVGCGLCADACPVDAIVGAPGLAWTVLRTQCTGCELCVAPCPTDCIAMTPLAAATDSAAGLAADSAVNSGALGLLESPPSVPPAREVKGAAACIRCGACDAVCPAAISPLAIYAAAVDGIDASAARRCIECGKCDAACPSSIALTAHFRGVKRRLRTAAAQRRAAAAAKTAFARRNHRREKIRISREAELQTADAAVAQALARIASPTKPPSAAAPSPSRPLSRCALPQSPPQAGGWR